MQTPQPAVSSDSSTLDVLLEHVPSLLRGFSAFDNAALAQAIDDVLARLGRIVEVDRTYLFRVWRDADGARFVDNDHEWCAPGIEPQIDELQALPVDDIEPLLVPLEAGEAVYIPRVADLPADRPDRAGLLAQDIRSLLVTPMIGAGELVGFIGFDAVRSERQWSEGERLLLGVVADAVCSALLRQVALQTLSERERRFRLLAEHSSDLGVVVGSDGRLLDVSPSATALMGWEPVALAGTELLAQVHPEDRAHLSAALQQAAAAPQVPVQVADHRYRHGDGAWRWFSATAIDLRQEAAFGGTVLVAHDIDDRKLAEHALAHQALHDPLTGLPNRGLLLDRLEQALERARRHGGTVAVVFLDLDRFKLVNDSLGHARGDEVLQACAARLSGTVRDTDTVARFGGDEFVVVLEGATGPSEAWKAAERVMTVLQDPITTGGGEHRLTASAGCVLAEGDEDARELLRDADAAMYQAKAGGRDQLRGLDQQLRDDLLDEAALVHDLRGAVDRDELTVEYQPILDLSLDRCVGYEALARWEHPQRGRIGPDRFIPLAEEHGLMAGIAQQVQRHSLRQLAAWDRRDPAHVQRTMAVNLSATQLYGGGLVEQVRRLLSTSPVRADRVVFELTESTLMAEPDVSRRVLSELRGLGCGIAIDDFGTGHSSLAYLRELPVTMLKIDRSFVQRLGEGGRDERVVHVVLTLAREFGLRTVAEGIETTHQLRVLESLGCRYGQGFLLGRAASPEVLEAQTFMPMALSSSRT